MPRGSWQKEGRDRVATTRSFGLALAGGIVVPLVCVGLMAVHLLFIAGAAISIAGGIYKGIPKKSQPAVRFASWSGPSPHAHNKGWFYGSVFALVILTVLFSTFFARPDLLYRLLK